MDETMIDWSRCATVPRQHQKDGVYALARRVFFALFDEVGAGKSKQVVDASQVLFEAGVPFEAGTGVRRQMIDVTQVGADGGLIDTVVVVAPAYARGVWGDPNPALGEVAKHSWPSIPYYISEYSVNKPKGLDWSPDVPHLRWVVTNYEFIRREERLMPLLRFLRTRKFLLVCDESWNLNDDNTAQWKATHKIRRLAARVVLLNGTPGLPMNLRAQMKMLDPSILGFWDGHKNRWNTTMTAFRARYAQLNPNTTFPMITGWQNLEELRDKIAPHVLRRRTRDCFDLPPILEPILIEAKLDDANWKIYKQMRDTMVAWLGTVDGQDQISVANLAIVKSLRLAQITSGFIGGIQTVALDGESLDFDAEPGAIDTTPAINPLVPPAPKEIGREKLDAMLDWVGRLGEDAPERLLIWCHFRLEVERTALAMAGLRRTYKLYGDQKKADREAAVAALNPAIPVTEPVSVVGNPSAGGAALNLAGASIAISLSHERKLRVYLQAKGRIDRPGQTQPIRYVDVVATGPKGQRTMDHHILAALRENQDLSEWTAATWRTKLLEE